MINLSITLFTSSTCAYCPIVKNQLASKGVEYTEVSIDDYKELATQHNILTVPTILDENDEVFRGLQDSLKKINEI